MSKSKRAPYDPRQDQVTVWLLERGRDPLEAVFLPVADDLYAAFPGYFAMSESDYAPIRAARKEAERAALDEKLKAYLSGMPKPLHDRLGELIDQRVQRALAERGKVAA